MGAYYWDISGFSGINFRLKVCTSFSEWKVNFASSFTVIATLIKQKLYGLYAQQHGGKIILSIDTVGLFCETWVSLRRSVSCVQAVKLVWPYFDTHLASHRVAVKASDTHCVCEQFAGLQEMTPFNGRYLLFFIYFTTFAAWSDESSNGESRATSFEGMP